MQKIKTHSEDFALVIGKGSAGNRHVATISDVLPDIQVQQIGARMADSAFFDNLQGNLPRFAVIASPATQHTEHAVRLMALNVPVIIEKPMAETAAAANRIVEVAKDFNATVQVGYVMRFYPALGIIKDLLRTGTIGTLLFAEFQVGQHLPDWRPLRDYRNSVSANHALGGGVLLELSHEIDTIVGLFGIPHRVACSTEKVGELDIDVEDFANISLWFNSSTHHPKRVEIQMDFLRRNPSRKVEIHGTDGTILWDVLKNSVGVFRPELGRWEPPEVPAGDQGISFHLQLRSFLEALDEPIDGSKIDLQALRVLEIIESCRSSVAAGGASVAHQEML